MHAIEQHLSPNFGPRRNGAVADMVVIHYTGMASADAAIDRLADPSSEVSAHYVVCSDGRLVSMVPGEMRAWHAGVSKWGAVSDINSHSIGIEVANPGRDLGYPPFSERQMSALEYLLRKVMQRHRIAPERVVGHACVAPGRKFDPGEKFDWRRLAQRGSAVWLDCNSHETGSADAARFQRAACDFGYAAPMNGTWCPRTLSVWEAFVMRFLPTDVGEGPSSTGVAHLERLARRWPVLRGT